MNDDLIERLRKPESVIDLLNAAVDAADEIARLRARLEQAERSRDSWIKTAVEQGKTIKRLRALAEQKEGE